MALHPTVKPVQLVADAILDCSARGDIVLDGFLGSGTTLIAAERVGRVCYAIELDPLYVDTAIRRWQALTGDAARHAASNLAFDQIARASAQSDNVTGLVQGARPVTDAATAPAPVLEALCHVR